jgi:protein ImuB
MAPQEKFPARGREAAPTPSAGKPPRTPKSSADTAKSPPAQQSLSLAPPVHTESRNEEGPARQLWLCIHLPSLPLDALNVGNRTAPQAVFEDRQGIRRVLLVNLQAEQEGIFPGLSINAALALAPALQLEERNPQKEHKRLRQLAAWAERFTSKVSIEPPEALLLEIAGSLKLFGGLDALRERVRKELFRQGCASSVAVAPTPLAAAWLARAGENVSIKSMNRLAGALGSLPLRYVGWPDDVRESLKGMGICCIGDCLRLPRQGFARRFGTARLRELDRALGRLPDPRRNYRPPERYSEDFELIEEQNDSELLLEACRQLLSRLERFLTTRQLAASRLRFSFFHLREEATHLTLGCMLAGRSVEQWFQLLALRFERLTLPAPVILIRLRAGRTQPLQAATGRLHFDGTRARGHLSITHLMERLSARMGEQSVHGMTLVPEHRPHYVWKAVQASPDLKPAIPADDSQRLPALLADKSKTPGLLLRRPLWMLREPRPLPAEAGKPTYQGSLRLLEGPERLETGWWDGNGIARDYFVAINPRGMRLWIYRNRKPPAAWYLHGLFG